MFNKKGIIFGQVVDSFFSIGSSVVLNTLGEKQAAGLVGKIAGWLNPENPELAHDKASYIVNRIAAQTGPISNIAVQALQAGAEHGREGAIKSLKNGIVAKAISIGIVNTVGYQFVDSAVRPIAKVIQGVLEKSNPTWTKDRAEGIAMGVAGEIVTTAIGFPITMLANGWRPSFGK